MEDIPSSSDFWLSPVARRMAGDLTYFPEILNASDECEGLTLGGAIGELRGPLLSHLLDIWVVGLLAIYIATRYAVDTQGIHM